MILGGKNVYCSINIVIGLYKQLLSAVSRNENKSPIELALDHRNILVLIILVHMHLILLVSDY